MDSKPELCTDCSHGVAQAYAQLRSLTSSYLRGEIELSAFNTLTGEVILRYDMEVAQRKLDVALQSLSQEDELGAGKHRLGEPEYHWPTSDVPVVDLEDSCMRPAVHDGTGDCGCPEIAED